MKLVQLNELKSKKPSEYLREGMHKYEQIRGTLADPAIENSRCAVGVILSEQGWDGQSPISFPSSQLPYTRITTRNDQFYMSFEQIAQRLEYEGL